MIIIIIIILIIIITVLITAIKNYLNIMQIGKKDCTFSFEIKNSNDVVKNVPFLSGQLVACYVNISCRTYFVLSIQSSFSANCRALTSFA